VLADGVASEIELLRERLVDDRDLRRAGVGARELAPAISGSRASEVAGPISL
jgi:hypothetical protein